MKIKYKGKVYEAKEYPDGSIRSIKGEVFLGFSINGLIEGAEVQKDAPVSKKAT